MELWVRTQDRLTLLKINIIELKKFEEGYGIINYIDGDNWFGLGLYKSKERALEVLDEIQNILKPQIILSKIGEPIAETCDVLVEPDEYDIKELSTYVYEMPEE